MSVTKKAIWEEEGDHFWQQLTFPEEDRHLHTSAPWDGGYRWFRSPWGWLTTSTEVDDRVYVGSREWRQRQLGNLNVGSHRANVGSHIGELELPALSSN
jgi:hypothetical protein